MADKANGVQRYGADVNLEGVASVSGRYVEYSDYEQLQAKLEAAERREKALQRALNRWLPEIAGDDSRGPMYAAASEDSLLLMGLSDGEPECYGQQLFDRAESAEALASQIGTDWLPANEQLAARAEAAEQRVWEAIQILDLLRAGHDDLKYDRVMSRRGSYVNVSAFIRDALQGTGSGSADNG